MSATTRSAMEMPIDRLYATAPATLPFDHDVDVRSFLLSRPQGNLIVYNAPGLAAAAGEIEALGGAQRQLINHGHEAMFGSQGLDVDAYVGERDRSETATALPVAETFTAREMLDQDLEVIPTPGHTPGTTCFLWNSGGHRMLFSGDMLWLERGQWRAVLLGSSDRACYLDSLALLRDIDFDVLVPWGATAGRPYIDIVDADQRQRRLDTIIQRVADGADS